MSRLGLVCIFSITFLVVSAQRKILSGKDYSMSKGYVVYLLKATREIKFDAWLCGGAIVRPSLIVTSAACVEDVKHIYAIAGYDKYVTYEQLNSDACTTEKKKKIVYVCIPSEYTFDYPAIEKWANIDLAVAKVESPYDFEDSSYHTHCSYKPSMIEVNYDSKYEVPDTEAIVYGWGHTKAWRSVSDTTDYNAPELLYGSVKLANKEICKKDYDNAQVQTIIEKYMVCSIQEGSFDDQGQKKDNKVDEEKLMEHCGPGSKRVGRTCVRASGDEIYDYRRSNTNVTNNETNGTHVTQTITRRRGICQNDHGGPLITWRETQEIMIGVASVFRVEQGTNNCIPPFLYTSTACNEKFLNCLLNELETEGNRRFNWEKECLTPPKERGFDIIRRTISWIGHPDGPALNEMYGVNIQRRENNLSEIQNSQNIKPEIKNEHINEPKTPEASLTHKYEAKPVESQGGDTDGFDDDVKFSDLLRPNLETN